MQKEGPILWEILHTTSFYIEQKKPSIFEKKTISLFFRYFLDIIPCNKCKKYYYYLHLNYNPIYNINDNKIIDWSISIHNTVNVKLNKEIKKKEYVENIYKNKSINNILIINYLIRLFYNHKIDIFKLIRFVNCFQYIYPDNDFKEKFIYVNNYNNLLLNSYKFKHKSMLVSKYKELINI